MGAAASANPHLYGLSLFDKETRFTKIMIAIINIDKRRKHVKTINPRPLL